MGKTTQGAHKVFMYSGEYQKLEKLVLGKTEIETGGDLFGLWVDESTVVLQVITGPGNNCKRTETSFFQDIEYLENTGNHLTRYEGLCNVGEWHSHHQLGLPQPSGGDQRTVWENLPKLGLPRFVLLIANITGNVGYLVVNLGAFLFVGGANDMVKVEIEKLDGPSPFRSNDAVVKVLEFGEENDQGVPEGSRMVNGLDKIETVEAKEEVNTPKKNKKKKKKNKKNKSGQALAEQPHEDGESKPNQEIPRETKASSKPSELNKKAQPVPPRKDIETQNKDQKLSLSKKPEKNKGKGKKGTKNNPTSCNPTSTHVSTILDSLSTLCKDLDYPGFTVDNDSQVKLSVEITKNGTRTSLSVSKNSCESNCLPDIKLSNENGTVVQQLCSWQINEKENQKQVENLKKKFKNMSMVKTASSNFLMNIWKSVQARLIPSNCVIL